MTRVVNLKHSTYDVYIGRVGRGEKGYFGNPYKVGETCDRCGRLHKRGGETLECYTAYFHERLASDQEFKAEVEKLRGKTLGCFCKPGPCHGDIIVAHLDAS